MIQYNSPEVRPNETSILLNPMLSFILWFNTFYSRKKRISLHLLMWLVFFILVEFGLLLTYHLSFSNSLFFVARSLVTNVMMFYSFFYLIFPCFFLKGRFFSGILLTISAIFLWLLLEHFSMITIHEYANLGDTGLKRQIDQIVATGFTRVYTLSAFFGSLIYIIIAIAPLFCVKVIVDVTQSAYMTTMLEKEKAELEVNFLKSQLNPHFLFNTLNTVYILNMKKDESASDVILEFSDVLRYTLYESDAEIVSLEKELIFLENYINLERIRQNKQTKISFNCDFENTAGLTIAPLLTFPFIENAFKYGLGTTLTAAWLEMDARVLDGSFYFSLKNSKNEEDNGVPIDEKTVGAGVANTMKRLAILYAGKHILKIIDTPQEYSIMLTIDLKHE